MAGHSLGQSFDDRIEPRDAVYHRTRAMLADGRSVPVTVVNLSPHGMMARIDVELAAGEWLNVRLPVVGTVTAGIRWSLGGRIGCQFDRSIAPRAYGLLLAAAAV